MITDIEFLKKITHGAVKIVQNDEGYNFYRMTEAQMHACTLTEPEFIEKAAATSGVRFEFITDAESFSLKGILHKSTTRFFAYIDVAVNGVLVQHEGTEDFRISPVIDMTVKLDGKKNKVTVYLPCLARFVLREINFKNSSVIEPVEKKFKMLCWGDSITQGYDAHYSALTYTNQLSDALDAEVYNKAIGAEYFNPAYFTEPDPVKPDLMTVAYGTNDWNRTSIKRLHESSYGFFENMNKFYPDVPVYVFLPLWRKDFDRVAEAGTFAEARDVIIENCRKFSNITMIDTFGFIPHIETFFEDKYLHPNDLGFMCMVRNLLKYIKVH